MPERLLFARAVGEAREHAADLADDLGVIGAERDMRFGVARRELQRLSRLAFTLPPRPCASALAIEISCE